MRGVGEGVGVGDVAVLGCVDGVAIGRGLAAAAALGEGVAAAWSADTGAGTRAKENATSTSAIAGRSMRINAACI
jgi:hypothetical protein